MPKNVCHMIPSFIPKSGHTSPLKRLQDLPVYIHIRFANMLTRRKSDAIKHHPEGIDALLDRTWRKCALLYIWMTVSNRLKKLISSTRGSHLKSSWTTFLGKLTSSDPIVQNMLPMMLLQILLRESTSRDADYKPYWTPAYKELSAKLLSPIGIDCVVSDSNSLSLSSQVPGGGSQFSIPPVIKVPNRNLPTTCCQLSTFTVADRWGDEATQEEKTVLKTIQLRLRPTSAQKAIIDEHINTSNFVYNKCVSNVYADPENVMMFPNYISLRDKLVTSQSRKANPEYERLASAVVKSRKEVKRIEKAIETSIKQGISIESEQLINLKQQLSVARGVLDVQNIPLLGLSRSTNNTINEWELNTPKAIRAEAVNDVCKAMKTGYANLKAGNIRHFRLGFRKKTAKYKSMSVPKDLLSNINGNLQLCPNILKGNSIIRIHNRTKKKHKNFSIKHDARLVKRNNEYWILLPTTVERKEEKTPVNFCGVDPGVRTFMTAFGNKGTTEYEYRAEMLSRLEKTIDKLTYRRTARGSKRISRRRLCKVEKRKENLINDLHWKTINHLVKNNDYIFYGDITRR